MTQKSLFDSDTKKLKEQLDAQQEQIAMLQKELSHIRGIALVTQRELRSHQNDRERIAKFLRPLLPIARTLRGFIRRVVPSSTPSTNASNKTQYITVKSLSDLETDQFEAMIWDSKKKEIELIGSTIQGFSIKDTLNNRIASSCGYSPDQTTALTHFFLSARFIIEDDGFSSSMENPDYAKLDKALHSQWIERSDVFEKPELEPIDSLRVHSKKGKCQLYFPAINTGTLPSIEVIIPVHNDRKRLEHAIRSILNQYYDGNVKVIVVDDGSTDNPQQIVKQFDNARYIRLDENLGVYSARNAGLEAATGDLVTFQDSDDISMPYRLARTAYFLSKSDADLYIGSYLRIDRDGRIVTTNNKARRNGLILLAGKRELILDRLGGFDRVRGGADSEFLERAEATGLKVFYDDVITYFADHGQTGLTVSGPLKMWDAKGQRKGNKTRESYVSAYRNWHQSSSFVEFPTPHNNEVRQFQVPSKILDGSWSKAIPVSGNEIIDMAMQRYCLMASPFDRTKSWFDIVTQARSSSTKITIVIVSNRGGDLVKNAFHQVRAFHYPQLQVIYVANATHAVMSEEVLGDDIMQIKTDASKNLGYCLNLAARTANGEYFFKLDDDDYYGPDYVAEAVAALENGYDFVGKWSIPYHFDDGDDMILRPPARDLQQANHLSGATFAIKTDLVRDLGFSETLPRGVDSNFVEKAKANGVILFSTSAFNFAVERRCNSKHTWKIKRNDLLERGVELKSVSLPTMLDPLQ